jgi:hypothetical protein
MAIAIDTTINVIPKYRELIDESLGTGSVYIRTKETLLDLFEKGSLTGQEKAKVISEVLGNLNSSLVNSSMRTAFDWAAAEKGNEFSKEELDYQLQLLEQQKKVEEAKERQVNASIMTATAESLRMHGTPTYDPTTYFTTALSNDGKVWEDILLGRQQILNTEKELDILESRLKESQASVYKIVADTAANFGAVSWTLTDTSCTPTINLSSGDLAYEQIQISKEQAKGYSYNAWSNAVNASATTVGMLVSENVDPTAATSLLSKLELGIDNLINTTPPL